MKKIPQLKWSDILKCKAPDLPSRLLAYANRYGDILKINPLLNSFLVNHPEAIEHILKKNMDNYSKEFRDYQRLGMLLGAGLLTTMGTNWGHRRRILQAHFQHQALHKLASITVEKTKCMLDGWEWYAKHRQPINIVPEMLNLVLDISLTCLFTVTYCNKKLDQMVNWFATGQRAMNRALTLKPWIPTFRNIQFRNSRRKIEKEAQAILEKRKKLDKNLWPDDMLTTLLSMHLPESNEPLTEQMIWDEMITFMATGHETTGNALAWAWHTLSQNQHALERLQNEIDNKLDGNLPEYHSLADLPFSKSVVQEVLRLYPTVWSFARRAIQTDLILDYEIPAQSLIVISPYVMHRLDRFWEQPNDFLPDRFFSENSKRIKTSYLPFGTGPHICIASAFSFVKLQIIIAMMVQRFQLELLPESIQIPYEPLISLRPLKPIRFLLHAR